MQGPAGLEFARGVFAHFDPSRKVTKAGQTRGRGAGGGWDPGIRGSHGTPDGGLLPWLIKQIKTANLSGGADLRLVASVAAVLDDEGLEGLRATGEAQIRDLEQQLYNASEDAERQRLGSQLKATQEELRRQLIEALGKRR